MSLVLSLKILVARLRYLVTRRPIKVKVELPTHVAEAVDRILKEDRRQKSYLAGCNEDKFEYKGLTPAELARKLRERGVDFDR